MLFKYFPKSIGLFLLYGLTFLTSLYIVPYSTQAQTRAQQYFSKPINTAGVTLAAVIVAATIYNLTGRRRLFTYPDILLRTQNPLDKTQIKEAVEKISGFRQVVSPRSNEDLFADESHNYIQVKYKKKNKHRIRFISNPSPHLNPLVTHHLISIIGFEKGSKAKHTYSDIVAKEILQKIESALKALDK